MEVVCTCGYKGNKIVQFETHVPSRQVLRWTGSWWDSVEWRRQKSVSAVTLNWACPECGKILVQQRGGLSYNQHELKDMELRLWRNSWANRRWLREMIKVRVAKYVRDVRASMLPLVDGQLVSMVVLHFDIP